MAEPWYATRETIARALDVHETVYTYAQVDRAAAAGSRRVEAPDVCNRRFYPEVDTRYFTWPQRQTNGYTIDLGRHELISVTTLTNGDGNTISSADYFLEPVNVGPPFKRIEIDLSSSESFDSGDTTQRSITVAGVFSGWTLDQAPAGALAAALSDTTGTTATVTNGALIGVGDLLTIDSERLIVTDRAVVDSSETLGDNIDGEVSTTTVPVSDGTAFAAGEMITIDAEVMLINSISGNNLLVRRSVEGSTLAAHTSGAAVYASRSLTVTRGALGTTAATHTMSTAVTTQTYPDLVVTAAVAAAIDQFMQERSGYARTVGTGEGERNASGAGLGKALAAARKAHGRKGRTYA